MKDESIKKLWSPDSQDIKRANLTRYMEWLRVNKSLHFTDYQALWEWSVEDINSFWRSLWDYFQIMSDSDPVEVLSADPMPGTKWFKDTSLNYAEHIFRNKTSERPAIIFKSELGKPRNISWDELSEKVAGVQRFLIDQGVQPGDRVAAYIPNIPEASISFLAVNSIGAIWSSVSPDFGTSSVVDRFSQINPSVLIAVDGCTYGGKAFDKTEEVQQIVQSIPTLKTVIHVPYLEDNPINVQHQIFSWHEVVATKNSGLVFTRMPFNHPIWILYSSGTTGLPKAITHSAGGVLLEHLKYLSFHNDVHPGEVCFWYTTTGWMMWNYIQASLLCGSTIVLYDGSPAYPDIAGLWQLVQDIRITHFGTSAGYISACMKKNIHPGNQYDLSSLRSIGSTGSPLSPESFDWIYTDVKADIWLASISGGTDVCSAFVGGNPLWPVHKGEIQCRALGCKLESFDQDGNSVVGQMGEMVITKPMPCMPIYFWNDTNFVRYKESYFEMYPGVWRHGDWTEITGRNGVIIYGRSDSTLNRSGIRIGTSEIYRAVDPIPEIADSLVVFFEKEGHERMPLFVVLAKGFELDDKLIIKIKSSIRNAFTARHVPDEVIQVDEIPYTISGKKMETPVKKILMGMEFTEIVNKDAMKNPEALQPFIRLASNN